MTLLKLCADVCRFYLSVGDREDLGTVPLVVHGELGNAEVADFRGVSARHWGLRRQLGSQFVRQSLELRTVLNRLRVKVQVGFDLGDDELFQCHRALLWLVLIRLLLYYFLFDVVLPALLEKKI